jgi:hypothetical protein
MNTGIPRWGNDSLNLQYKWKSDGYKAVKNLEFVLVYQLRKWVKFSDSK